MINSLRRTIKRLASRWPSLSLLHTLAVGSEHAREFRAVAAGQRRHARDNAELVTSNFQLRRNIHRLEKGLIMRPRRASFAADYIGETLAVYTKACAAPDFDRNEREWASDVLAKYFAEVEDGDPRIAAARQAHAALISAQESEGKAVPFHRDLDAHPVTPEALHALAMKRRSVRWYSDKPVPRELVDEALLTAAQAPSACNRQPFQFRLFDDPARAAELASIAMGTKGFAQQIPCLAVIVGRLRAYPYSRDRHAIYIDASLAAMSFMFALETRGLASCPINWPDEEPYEGRMRAAIGLEDDERVIMLVAFGWPDPDGMVPYSAKKGLAELRQYEDRDA